MGMDDEAVNLNISLFSGNLGDFEVILGARTDDNSSNSTAVGKKAVCKSTFLTWKYNHTN